MAPRPSWKGYLRLSLVSCPVALYTATSASEKVSLHLLNGETRHRLKQQYVDSVTGDIVERDDRVRGYEIAKGDYVVVDDDELADLKLESNHTIDIEQFVPRPEIDRLYFDSNYYVMPDDKVGEEAFAVIREAMTKRGVVGIARVVLFGKERMVMLEPRSKGLLGTTLRYGYEVKDEGSYLDELPSIDVSKELLDLASHIIDTKAGTFDPDRFKDRYQDAVIALVKSKQDGREMSTDAPAERPNNVVNLLDALRRSLGQPDADAEQGTKSSPTRGRASGSSKAPRKHAGKSDARTATSKTTKSKSSKAKATHLEKASARKTG